MSPDVAKESGLKFYKYHLQHHFWLPSGCRRPPTAVWFVYRHLPHCLHPAHKEDTHRLSVWGVSRATHSQTVNNECNLWLLWADRAHPENFMDTISHCTLKDTFQHKCVWVGKWLRILLPAELTKTTNTRVVKEVSHMLYAGAQEHNI